MPIPSLGLGTKSPKKDEKTVPDTGLGTEAGDIPNLSLETQEDVSFGEKFAYGMVTTPSFSEGIGDYLERRFPLGRVEWYTPGEGYHLPRYVAPPKQVVEAARKKNYDLAKQFLLLLPVNRD